MNNKKNIVILLNICIFFILFYILFLFQQYFYLVYHDYLIPYIINGIFPDWGRIPASFLYRFTKEVLPNFLNIHPQDAVSSIEAVIKSISFLTICTVVLSGFYITSKEKFKISNIENIFILPAIFFIMGIPVLFLGSHNMYFGKMQESVVYFEYFFALLFYFSFFILFLYISLTDNKINLLLKIIILLNSFLLGFWNELFNVATLFSTIVLIILMLIFNKEKLKNKNFLYLISPLIIGIICFYIFSGYSTGTKLVGYSYNWGNLFVNIKINLFDFVVYFVKYMVISKLFFYLIIFSLSFLLWKRKNFNVSIILISSFSILLGYFLMNLLLIIYREVPTITYSGFLFQRELYQILYINILEFVIFLLLGAVYFIYYERRKIIIFILIIINIILISIYIQNNIQVQIENKNAKELAYKIEKNILIYSILGETAILPASFLKEDKIFSREIFMFDDKYRFEREFSDYDINKYSILMKNRHFDPLYILHRYYIEKTYNKKFIGVIFLDDKISDRELRKRQELLGFKDENEATIIKKHISFEKLIKYKKYNLSLEQVSKFKKNNENKDIILKTTAYLNYRDGRLDEALNLYLQYLKKAPCDFNALMNIGNIYIKLNDYKNAELIYKKLNKLDENNLIFLYKLLYIYNKNNENKKSLEICDMMIKAQSNMLNLYLNKALIYVLLGDINKAEKFFKYVEKKDMNKINEVLAINEVGSLEDIYKKKKIRIMVPTF